MNFCSRENSDCFSPCSDTEYYNLTSNLNIKNFALKKRGIVNPVKMIVNPVCMEMELSVQNALVFFFFFNQ